MSAPTLASLANLKRLLRYLAGTRDVGLMLKPTHVLPKPNSATVELELVTYCDSDWAGCTATRKSTTGTATQLLGCTIHHCSRTQATIALSSTEAETNALGTASAETLFLKQLLTDTNVFQNHNAPLH